MFLYRGTMSLLSVTCGRHPVASPSLLNYFLIIYGYITLNIMGLDSSVNIVTAYGLDGSGIESRWGRDFLHLSRPALRPTQRPVQWVLGLSRG